VIQVVHKFYEGFYSQFALRETASTRGVQGPNTQNGTTTYQLP
jgi:hypothetical protein